MCNLSLSTHDTSQLFLWVIRWAGKTNADGFSVIEGSTITAGSMTQYSVWISINTLKHGIMFCIKDCH